MDCPINFVLFDYFAIFYIINWGAFMKKLIVFTILIFSIFTNASEVENVQFSDLEGNSYDLYEILDRGTYVYIYIVSNG